MHFPALPWRNINSLKINKIALCYLLAAMASVAFVLRMLSIILTAQHGDHVLPAPPSASSAQQAMAEKLPRLGLFAEPSAQTEMLVADIAADDARLFEAPASQLPYQVAGILSSSAPEKASAIIISGKSQSMVSVGETLAGSQAEIIRVFADRVIIAHQGVYESLRMAQDRPASSR